MNTMYVNKNLASGAVAENFIEDIFSDVCKNIVYKLERNEWSGGFPPPGSITLPKFEVYNTNSEQIIAAFGYLTGSYCNEQDFLHYYKEINFRLNAALESRVQEWELDHPHKV